VADDTAFEENESEQNVLVPDLPLSEGTFPVEK
jgi:hypothetical protein